jgi:hypothetical protein
VERVESFLDEVARGAEIEPRIELREEKQQQTERKDAAEQAHSRSATAVLQAHGLCAVTH